jgi:hypothetical protein
MSKSQVSPRAARATFAGIASGILLELAALAIILLVISS